MKIIVKDYEAFALDGKFDGFCIEILKDEDMIEIFLYHKQYGIKSLMFGLNKTFENELNLYNIIANNIEEEIAMYAEKFMDDHYYENKF